MFDITIQEVLNNTKLNQGDLAQILGIKKITNNLLQTTPSIEQIEQIADRLGLELEALFEAQPKTPPLALLFREHRDRGELLSRLDDEDRIALGKFTQIARRIVKLEARTAQPEPALNRLRPHLQSVALVEGEEIAAAEREATRIRDALGLGVHPIQSMRSLLASLDITIITAELDEELNRGLDGASLLIDNRGFILINLRKDETKWWRTRMTLAHELGHLLMDRAQLSGTQKTNTVMVTLYQRNHEARALKQRAKFDHLEQRANAFAAALLVPSVGLRALIGGDDPAALESISSVMRHFQVGLQTAVNRLQNVFGLSYETRAQMLRADALNLLPQQHLDLFTQDEVGLRNGPLLNLVQQALLRGNIDRVEALKLLDLKLTDPIPAPSGHEQDPRFSPLISQEEFNRREQLKTADAAT